MSKILVTKKHWFLIGVMGLVLLVISMVFWQGLIQPKRQKLNQLKSQLVKVEKEKKEEEATLAGLQDLPPLLEAEVVKKMPIIPNGLQLQDYFTSLAKNDRVVIQRISFDDKGIFPVDGEQNTGAQNQLRDTTVGIDVLANSEEELIEFVKALENDQRYTAISQLVYRHNGEASGESGYSYSVSLVLHMYYLSHYETGQAFE